VKLRVLGAVLVGVLVLAGCNSNVGVAGRVGTDKISESQLSGYVTPSASVQRQATANGVQEFDPKPLMLSYLMEQSLLRQALAAKGGQPVGQELSGARDSVVEQYGSEQDLTNQITAAGLTPSAAQLVITVETLGAVLRSRLGGQAPVDFINGMHVPIYVNPRFGSWDPRSLSVDAQGGRPSFLQLQQQDLAS
jgi:outer membrane murein-binding lipoprotein Lpp